MTEHPAISLSDITVRFGGIVAVASATAVVGPGECVGLIGPNGAGKTTLLDVAAGVRRPQQGAVTLFGKDITRSSVVRRSRLGIARTFQQISLFDAMTVREHILLGYLACCSADLRLRGYVSSRRRVEAMARADRSPLSPHSLLKRLRLEDIADELAGEQSVGTVRMIDLARALASRPRVLLLDEPVSGLSEGEVDEVGVLLRELRDEHKMSMLVVEHNLEFARSVADRLIALDFGKVIASGRPDDVLASDALRSAYFGASSEGMAPAK